VTVYVTGDTHGGVKEYQALKRFALEQGLTRDDVIIIAGDAGVYYGGKAFGPGRTIMKESPCRFLIVRGNHDDRITHIIESGQASGKWSRREILGNAAYVNDGYPNVYYALDEGGLYEIDGEKVLIVPGAYSIDKYYRLENGFPYNPYEQLNPKEMDDLLQLAEDNPDITGVIAHTAPQSWEPCFRDLFFKGLDQSRVDKTTDKFLDTLVEKLPNLNVYYFGHFHADRNCGEHGVMIYHEVLEYGKRHGETII